MKNNSYEILLILTKYFIWFKSIIVPITCFNKSFNTSEKIKERGTINLWPVSKSPRCRREEFQHTVPRWTVSIVQQSNFIKKFLIILIIQIKKITIYLQQEIT